MHQNLYLGLTKGGDNSLQNDNATLSPSTKLLVL